MRGYSLRDSVRPVGSYHEEKCKNNDNRYGIQYVTIFHEIERLAFIEQFGAFL
jgi:hypothetical protein